MGTVAVDHMTWIERGVRRGDTVLDIGANAGAVTTELLAAVGATGRVIAIEPQRVVATDLQRRFPRVEVIAAAVSDHDTRATFYHSKDSRHSSLYQPNVLEPLDSEEVSVVTLDSLLTRGLLPEDVAAIKVDAQGAEAAIVRGASRLLAKRRAIWFMELWALGLDQAGDSVEAVADVFLKAGYAPEGYTWETACRVCRNHQGNAAIDVLVTPV